MGYNPWGHKESDTTERLLNFKKEKKSSITTGKDFFGVRVNCFFVHSANSYLGITVCVCVCVYVCVYVCVCVCVYVSAPGSTILSLTLVLDTELLKTLVIF